MKLCGVSVETQRHLVEDHHPPQRGAQCVWARLHPRRRRAYFDEIEALLMTQVGHRMPVAAWRPPAPTSS